ncbi:MSC_0882 family membrane protein [Mycoplasmopsis edwardii]|uniref:Uncharacterized protein n=2 Tax=Mycoplasmopsis edwardii TaxID=53558 RepID=A0ACD4PHQ3_9BACT|nr:hypothetical protein [Mycoplasmopsis edwardii]WBP84036.1 hypothetical protein Me_995_000670 [Mycoplasmopsis edwardii]
MFRPKRPNEGLELKTAQVNLQNNNERKLYTDPQKQLNPQTYTIIRKERNVRVISAIFWGLIVLGSIIGMLTNFLWYFINEKSNGIVTYYILLAFPLLISFMFMTKSLIKVSGWSKVRNNFRTNYLQADASSSSMFVDIYQALVLKGLRLTWGLVFFLTYFGLFNIIILALKDQIWEIGSNFDGNTTSNGFNVHFLIDFSKWFKTAFGNVNLLLIIDLCVILGVIALYVLVILYDKKRIQDIQANFGTGENAIAVKKLVEERRRAENKAWIKTYIIIFVIVVLIPLVLILFLIYKKFIRRKA